MARSLFIAALLVLAGCPRPIPPPDVPTPIVYDGGASDSVCHVDRETQDRLTNKIVNACATQRQTATLDALAVTYPEHDVRCVAADILLDLRGAEKTETCVSDWLRSHGGAP